MRNFMKKRKKLLITGGAVVLVAAVAVTGFIVSRPTPSELTGKAGEISKAAAADDWAALPVDGAGQPIGEPESPRDKNGNLIIAPGMAEEKRGADQPLPVVALKDQVEILDTTGSTAGLLGMLLEPKNSGVGISNDDCLLDWAKTTLPTVKGAAFSGVMDVCGREAAVMYGGYSTSVRDLNLHALYAPDKAERKALSKVLFKNDRLGYASIATKDGKGILLVAAPVTGATAKADTTDPIFKTEPVAPERPAVLPDAP
jgi:hypothetical protein